MVKVLVFCVLIPICLGISEDYLQKSGIKNLDESYPFSITLKEGQYYLYWNFSSVDESIHFAVRVRTTGWIGFGLSSSGQMTGSDVVIGWIDTNGEPFFHDRFAHSRSLPPIDSEQNWFLTNSQVEDGYTQLEFHRKFITCDDDYDREIHEETSYIVFSWNDNKPTVNSDQTFSLQRHQARGQTAVNLLGGLPVPPVIPNDANTFNVTVIEAELPEAYTEYLCQAVRLPQEILNQERYIIKVSPALQPDTAEYVHHLIVYVCNGLQEEDLGATGDCTVNQVSPQLSLCLISQVIGSWAVGGHDFLYPDDVAYPIGGPGSYEFAVIQVHYTNPSLKPGVIDSSGLKFTYVNTKRKYDAGMLLIGHDVSHIMVVPPNSPDFLIPSFCPIDCFENYLPEEGIHIFANMLHTHLIGSSLELSVVDPVNCSGTDETRLEQSQIIQRNSNYDFNFQQFIHLRNEVVFKKGSMMTLNCHYDSRSRGNVTVGGESTLEEMCIALPVYYPRIDLALCLSRPIFDQLPSFIEQYVPMQYHDQFALLTEGRQPSKRNLISALNLLDWDEDLLQAWYDMLYANGTQGVICNDPNYKTGYHVPDVCCAYEVENRCMENNPMPCCERTCVGEVKGSANQNIASTVLAFTLIMGSKLLFN